MKHTKKKRQGKSTKSKSNASSKLNQRKQNNFKILSNKDKPNKRTSSTGSAKPSNVLTNLMKKFKNAKATNEKKRPCTSTDFCGYPIDSHTERTSFDCFKRNTLSRKTVKEKRKSISKHKRSTGVLLATTNTFADPGKISRNPSSSSIVKSFQSHLLNPTKSVKNLERKWVPKKASRKINKN